MTQFIKTKRYALVLAACCASLAFAQEDDETVELETFTTEESINDPLAIIPNRQIDSVFGEGQKIVDIPRSITIVEGATLDSYGIDSVGDIAAVSAGTFSNNQFGIEGNVDIRNTNGDNYFRGFKKLTNRGNFRTPIGAADRFEIIKGPPPVSYGVGSVGGLLNYYPKTARGNTTRFLESSTGKVTATVGTYDKKKISLEYGTPIEVAGKSGGVYTFLGLEDSGGFYNFVDNKDIIAQATFVLDLTDIVSIETGFQYGDFDQIQNPGWNRITQDLVDNHTYITGAAAVRNRDLNGSGRIEPFETDGNTGFGQFTNLIPGISLDANGGIIHSFSGLPLDDWIAANLTEGAGGIPDDLDGDGITGESLAALDLTGTTTISERTGFTEPEDYGISRNLTVFFDMKAEPSDTFSIKNQVFYDYYDTQRNTTYGFNNDYEGHVIENKMTAVINPDFGDSVDLSIITGISYRYTEMVARSAFLNEPFAFRDLTQQVTANERFAIAESNNVAGSGFNRESRIYDNWVESDYGDLGAFASINLTLFEKLNINAGYAYHKVDIDTVNFGWLDRASNEPVSDTESYDTYSGSISYDAPFGLKPYITFAEAAYIADGQASEVNVGLVRSETYIQGSDLIEGGVKGVLFDDKLYFSFAAFEQNRTEFSAQAGQLIGENTSGIELEVNWAINDNFFVTGNATWLKTQRKGSQTILGVPFQYIAEQQGISYEEALSRYGALRFNAFGGPIVDEFTTDPEEPGRPDKFFSLYGNYVSDFGLSATLGFSWYESVDAGYFGYVVLPSYFEWNGSVSYAFENGWNARVNLYNITDETGYKSQNLFFDELLLATQGFRADLSVSYAW
ncbi:MAG: TonB-dependent receptor [Opitutales bacterium]|nr:TonB-dependent receptor [Opitutales bacterium]NRA28093.1 TonB-dependent receptor [Opitutales bacterium]